MEQITKDSTKVIIFKKGVLAAVIRPPFKDNEVDKRIKNAFTQKAEVRRYYKPNALDGRKRSMKD